MSTAAASQDNWPRFRGPNADGVAPDHASLPTKWTTTEDVKWVAEVPGWGWSCPIVWGNRVFLTSVVSDEKSPFIAWYQGQSSAYNPSQLVYGDYLYTLYDRGFLTCHDAKTGKEVDGKRRFSPSGSFTASPWAYNGRLFFLSEDGLTYVVRAGPVFEIMERNPLDELCLASPAVVRGKLLIRTASKLYCLTEGAKLDSAAQARLKPARKASTTVDIWSAAADGNRELVARLLTAGTPINARQPGSGSTQERGR